jgi:hypothetical protein
MRDSLQDWEGIVQERSRSWEAEVRQRQLRAQIPRQRSAWQRRTGKWLIYVGGWLTQCGEEMAESKCTAGVSVAG